MRQYKVLEDSSPITTYELGERSSIKIFPNAVIGVKGKVEIEEMERVIENWKRYRPSLLKYLKEEELLRWEEDGGGIKLHLRKGVIKIPKSIELIRGFLIVNEEDVSYKIFIPDDLRRIIFPEEFLHKLIVLRKIDNYEYSILNSEYPYELLKEILDDLTKNRYCISIIDNERVILTRVEAQYNNLKIVSNGTRFECLKALSLSPC